MKNIIVLLIFILPLSGCNKCDDSRTNYVESCGGCPDDYIEFSKSCLYRGERIFYFGSIDFYCFNNDIAIAIDTIKKSIGGFIRDDISFTAIGGSNNYERGNFIIFDESCTMFTPLTTTYGFFTDDTSFQKLPKQIDLTFLHKETLLLGSRTIDSTQITMFRRDD